MKNRRCVSCGAPIPVGALKCEYCGMTYEPDYWMGAIKYVPLRKDSRKLVARTVIPPHVSLRNAAERERAGNAMRNDLAQKMAEALEQVMTVRISEDLLTGKIVAEGEVWVQEFGRDTLGDTP